MEPKAPTTNRVASCWALDRSDWAALDTSPMTVFSADLSCVSWSLAALTVVALSTST